MKLHVLYPNTALKKKSLPGARPGDLVLDLRNYAHTIYRIVRDQPPSDITAEYGPLPDYWQVAREWLVNFTAQTGIQDHLSVDGFGIWWALSAPHFLPSVSETGSLFAWIDLLDAVRHATRPNQVCTYGRHPPLAHLIEQIFPGTPIDCQDAATAPISSPPRSVGAGLRVTRLLLSVLAFIVALVRHPHVCFFGSGTLLRTTTHNGRSRLEDVYLGPVADALRRRGWRVLTIEFLTANLTWRHLFARGWFFPSDLVYLLGHPRLVERGIYPRTARAWQAKWDTLRPHLQPHLTYREYDISAFINPLLQTRFLSTAVHVTVMARLWRFLLRVWRTRALYINHSYGLAATSLIIAARSLRIPTIEQQHGIIAKNHLPYLIPDIPTRTRFPLCDYMVLWGEHTKRLLAEQKVYAPDHLFVCGFPRLDMQMAELAPRDQTLDQLDIPARAKVVLYTSNRAAVGYYADILGSVKRVPREADVYWIFKLHPSERTRSKAQQMIVELGLEQVRLVKGEIDLYALMAACDLHVSFISTTFIEAAVLEKPNLGLDIDNQPDPIGYTAAKALLPVSLDKLGPTVQAILADPRKLEDLRQAQRSFADDWCQHDGKAVDRIVPVVESLIR